MKALIVYNPRSGKGRFKRKLNIVIESLKQKGFTKIDIFESKKPTSITAYIIEALNREDFDSILVSGGDGTLHEAVNGLMQIPFERRPKLLYFPTGTINDVGHILGLNKLVLENIKLLDDDNVVLWDVCDMNGEYFDYVCGVGKYTKASYQTDHPKIKKVFGIFYYAWEGIKEIKQNYHMSLHIKNEVGDIYEGKSCLLLAMNTSRIGSLYISPEDIQLDDGKITTYIFDDKINVRIFTLIKFFLSGGKSTDGVTKMVGKTFEIQTQKKFRYNLDGEKAEKTSTAKIQVLKEQIPIYVSPLAKKTYFLNQKK